MIASHEGTENTEASNSMGSRRKPQDPENIHPVLVEHCWHMTLSYMSLSKDIPDGVNEHQQNRYFQWARVRVLCLLHYYFSDRTFEHIATCVGGGISAADVRRTLTLCAEDFRTRHWPFYQIQAMAFWCATKDYEYLARGLSRGFIDGQPEPVPEPGPIRIVRRLEEIDGVLFRDPPSERAEA